MSSVMFLFACLVLTYCPISLYNLPLLTSALFICLTLHQLYEYAEQRWGHNLESSVGSTVDTSILEAQLTDEESEEEKSEIKSAIENSVESDEEESSQSESEKSDQATPDKSEEVSRKNSHTSEISISSYEAVSLNEVKTNEEFKEKPVIEDQVLNKSDGNEDSVEEDEENLVEETQESNNEDEGEGEEDSENSEELKHKVSTHKELKQMGRVIGKGLETKERLKKYKQRKYDDEDEEYSK